MPVETRSGTVGPQLVKRLLLGRPMSSGELGHTLLPKVIALPVFSSDPLSSNAYATQEALIVLSLAGAVGMSFILPISVAVATLLAIVVMSYRQTVKAYPTGGGAYRVSHENLGMYPGLLAASALLIDYVLTVAVSITAGVEAIVSAAEGAAPYKIAIAFAFITFVTLMNLRGVKESGTLFAIPTYGFVLSIYLMIGTGIFKCIGGCPLAESAGLADQLHIESTLGPLLMLRAFAAGTTALTGVEAIADGVPAFRYPQSRNAATTLVIMAGLSISMFLGISWLADHTNVVYVEHLENQRSVVAQIAAAVFSGGPMFYLVQIMSAAILILAANTAYQDFPRLASILAKDRYMPRQFMNRGDRLVFSNGIVILAVLAGLLIYVFDAELTRLIQLYLVGVFISFTLSQLGMVMRGRKLREPGWQRSAAISGFGGTVTGIVLIVIAYSKFTHGAWIVLAAIPFVMYGMRAVYVHYTEVSRQLDTPDRKPADRRPGNAHFVIFIKRVDAATARAVGYAQSTRADITAVTFDRSLHGAWRRLAPDIPIHTLDAKQGTRRALLAHLRSLRAELPPDDFLTVVIPEILESGTLYEIARHPALHRLKAILVSEPGTQVLDIPILRENIDPMLDQAHEPGRNHAVVLISGVHNATLQALEYAETLQPTDIRALSFALDPEESVRLGDEWLRQEVPHPLEIEESPYRDLGESVVRYIERFRPDGIDRVVTIIIPEFIVKKRRHNFLHGQTALIVKRRMLFQSGVVVVSVPFHLE